MYQKQYFGAHLAAKVVNFFQNACIYTRKMLICVVI